MEPDRERDLAERKARLRARMRALRRAVEPRAALEAGARVAERLSGMAAFAASDVVILYAALGDELPTRPLFDALRARGKAALLPRMPGEGGAPLGLGRVERWEDLVPGRFGVPQPPPGAPAGGPAGLAILPGLAFDPRGRRLGRGGGHYDRALAAGVFGEALRVGVGYAFQLVEEVPAGPLDARVDAVVTDADTRWAADGGAAGEGRG